ncbi:MAG: ClpXP protease specificity-enhancing factor [Gammaproteobacteria bacterium]|jgi:stringent starvation protein B|nr:ClpXP protease specificity-enhancing factor [Gammaproteobacteria bacterium]MBU0892244.1 ClpXP protease specificity-enhancing factor [Gammaproteobacteria bacterium]MBU1353262.1 ClpXP protease specificity-enhancing factor [Gammaproteobacteria bacterium]MBU1507763.1 ClpXP protease specificity-enhancing factor [Gammaproteobacteria bacterium]MBU2120494.1 ClpXP protease specificity-enhancing factor [Gammaproteobacteria bacterium]
MNAQESTSTRPYLIRALYEWCTDNGLTPYVAVRVDDSVQVPREYVKDGEIVLNISFDATSSLQLGNDFIEFKARFGGKPREILVPVGRVIAIYARENGQGMAFPPPVDNLSGSGAATATTALAQVVAPSDAEPAGTAAASEDRVVQLVTTEEGKKDDGEDAPRPPPSSGGARPSLKRVK